MSSLTAIEKRLVERLEQTQVLSSEQLELVRELQRDSALSLAQALVELELLSQAEVERIELSIQEAKFVRLEDMVLDREAIRHVPARIARQHRCIPVRRSASTLVVACADPQDVAMQTALEGVTDCDFVYVTSDPEALEHAIYIHYGPERDGGRHPNGRTTGSSAGSKTPWQISEPWPQTFSSFVECEGNRRVREALLQLAASKHWDSCPVIVVGARESGKTHLLAALTAHVTKHEPLCRYLSLSGRELTKLIKGYLLAGRADYLRFEMRDRDLVVLDEAGECLSDRASRSELVSWLRVSRANGIRFVMAMTDEEYLSAANSESIREILSEALTLNMRPLDAAALARVFDERIAKECLGEQDFRALQTEEQTWSEAIEKLWNKMESMNERHGQE